MSEEFISMVSAMREAQREYFEKHTRPLLAECKILERKVDRWLQKSLADKVQLEMWTRSVKSSEIPGVYNTADEIETEEGGAA